MADLCKDILEASLVVLGMTEDAPRAVVARMLEELVAAGRLPARLRDAAYEAVHTREVTGGCTALANGIAIPHGYLDEVQSPIVAIGIHSQGVDCSSVDGEPSRIFVLILNHPGSRDHVRFLATINRRLIVPEVRAALLLAKSRDEVLRLLAAG